MKCTKCGAECREDVKFCTQCGAPMAHEVRGEEAQAAVGEEGASEGKEALETKSADGQFDQTAEGRTEGEPPVQTGGGAAGSPDQTGDSDADSSGPPEAWAMAGPPAQTAAVQPVQITKTGPQANQTIPGDSEPNKKFFKIFFAVIAIAIVISIASLAYVKVNTKDPKQVVIDAFKGVFPKNAASPAEELFGLKKFADGAIKSDRENGITLKLDSSSDAFVNAVAGGGIRLENKEDRTNNKSSMNIGAIYNGMDLANLNAYFGDDSLMMAIPELSSKVFTVDLGEGLADRIKNSPTVGPMLSDSGVDVDGLTDYLSELVAERDKGGKDAKLPFNIKALLNRYKEGSKAQENFKAALTVTEADKAAYTINAKEVKCQGYDVVISKDAMIDFLRTSSDFFLQDETLKDDYLKQMKATVRMSELMTGGMGAGDSMTAEEMQQETYDDMKAQVDKMISFLDKSMSDVKMMVYVDKKGKLAAVDASTRLKSNGESDDLTDGDVSITFHLELQGGAYLTQNMKGSIEAKDDANEVKLGLTKKGTYDGKKLTCDLSVDAAMDDGDPYRFTYAGAYDSADGSYHISAKTEGDGEEIVRISAAGVVDVLEKGKSVHMGIDSLEISAEDDSVVLSGEMYSRPLGGEIAPLKGTQMDVLSATQDDWNNVGMEIVLKGMGLAKQLGIPVSQ